MKIIKTILFKIKSLYSNAVDHFDKTVTFLYLKFYGVETSYGYVKLYGFPIIQKCKNSPIKLAEGCSIVSKTKYNAAGVFHRTVLATITENAYIEIGKSGISGAIICATEKILIGDYCGLGVNVRIYDTDFHPLNPIQRMNQQSIYDAKHAPVIIHDNVWIGADSIILKGSIINYAAVIGAGSVVKGVIPEMELHAGNPIRFIKKVL